MNKCEILKGVYAPLCVSFCFTLVMMILCAMCERILAFHVF